MRQQKEISNYSYRFCRIAKKIYSKIRIRQTLSHGNQRLSHRPKKSGKGFIRQSSHCSRDSDIVELSVPLKFLPNSVLSREIGLLISQMCSLDNILVKRFLDEEIGEIQR